MHRLISFLIWILIPLSLFGQELLTVEEAIRLGLAQNFDIRIARNTAEVARNNAGQGRAGFLPVIDASAGKQYSSSDQETNSPFSFGKSSTSSQNAQITLNWTLFDGMRMFIDRARYNRLAAAGEMQAQSQIETTVVAILRAYFNLVQQKQLLLVARHTLEISETRLAKEQTRREVGGASSTDLLNARVATNNDRSALKNQELQVLIARKELNLLLGRAPETECPVQEEISVPPLEAGMEKMWEQVKQRNSTLQAAHLNALAAADEARAARSAFIPRLSLNGSYGYLDRTLSSDSPRFPEDISTQSRDLNIGLTLSLNLFNGFRNKIEIQNARLNARNQKLTVLDQQNRLRGLLMEKLQTFRKQVEIMELEAENVKAATQNLELQQDRYRMGSSTSLDFRDAQLNLARTRISQIAARYQARITRLELEQLTGSIRTN